MSCLKEDEGGRKITDYKEYVLTVASEMKPGVIWSEGNVNGSMMGWSFLDEEGNETNYPSFDVFVGRSAKSKSVDLMSIQCIYIKILLNIIRTNTPKQV